MIFDLPKYMRDPDDGGGNGDPGADPDNGDKPVIPPVDPNANLKAVSDSIRAAIESARVPVAAAPVQQGPNRDLQAQLAAEADRVNARINELGAAGDLAGALAARDEFNHRVAGLTQANPNDNAIVKTAIDLGERMARVEHGPIMSRWADEVRRAVESLPLEERVKPNAWDRAVRDVRANHFDELMKETVDTRVAEERKKFVPPPSAPGSRGARQLQGPAAKLAEEQLWGADICGVAPDAYAKEYAREVAFDALPFKERAKFPGYPVLDDPHGNATVAPGKF